MRHSWSFPNTMMILSLASPLELEVRMDLFFTKNKNITWGG